MKIERRLITSLSMLDSFRAPDMCVGITSTVALNGSVNFNITTYPIDEAGSLIMYQTFIGDGDVKLNVYYRTYDDGVWSSWASTIGMGAVAVGMMQYDTVLGKPKWLKTVNPQIQEVMSIDFQSPNVAAVFQMVVTTLPTVDGTVTLTLGEDSFEAEVSTTMTATDVLTAIAAAVAASEHSAEWSFSDLTGSGTDTMFIYHATIGPVSAFEIADTDETGLVITKSTLEEGVATVAGDITITVDGVGTVVAIPAEATSAQVAALVTAEGIDGWTAVLSGGGVIFTCDGFGAHTTTFTDTDETGITGTVTVTTEGDDHVWVDATGTEL